jgi:hypothetical protein
VKTITEQDIRASFVNCSKGEARRLNLPRELARSPWDDLDFLGWRDPGAPERAYLVVERDGGLAGVSLRLAPEVRRSFAKSTLCSVCVTPHAGRIARAVVNLDAFLDRILDGTLAHAAR